ncbi:hypothetical protein, partial [Fischerella thermalis]|uniref:hypothetical protein n=1 Tax=Fischerella thermalis TaxID=372787 RepID=UPI001CA4A9DE
SPPPHHSTFLTSSSSFTSNLQVVLCQPQFSAYFPKYQFLLHFSHTLTPFFNSVQGTQMYTDGLCICC